MMRHWLGAALAAGLLYVAPPETASYGDYRFEYSPDLLVDRDFVYRDTEALGPRHSVVLKHREAQAGDLRVIEINMLRSLRQPLTCRDYQLCRVVDGVVIGTDCEDPEFRKAFEGVVSTFRQNK